jgi:hypothetical protein
MLSRKFFAGIVIIILLWAVIPFQQAAAICPPSHACPPPAGGSGGPGKKAIMTMTAQAQKIAVAAIPVTPTASPTPSATASPSATATASPTSTATATLTAGLASGQISANSIPNAPKVTGLKPNLPVGVGLSAIVLALLSSALILRRFGKKSGRVVTLDQQGKVDAEKNFHDQLIDELRLPGLDGSAKKQPPAFANEPNVNSNDKLTPTSKDFSADQ